MAHSCSTPGQNHISKALQLKLQAIPANGKMKRPNQCLLFCYLEFLSVLNIKRITGKMKSSGIKIRIGIKCCGMSEAISTLKLIFLEMSLENSMSLISLSLSHLTFQNKMFRFSWLAILYSQTQKCFFAWPSYKRNLLAYFLKLLFT